jgi:hypothetical protein
LVSGLGKTGTSGVYTSIKTALAGAGHDMRTFFEPSSVELLHECFRHSPKPVLAKLILQELLRVDLPPAAFDRRVMTVRDPRDTAISGLLFRPLITAVMHRLTDAQLEQFLDALRAKEKDTLSVSVVDLYRLSAELGMGSRPRRLMTGVLTRQQAMIDGGGFHVVRYEDFVAGRLDGLSEYLGVEVRNVSTSGSKVSGHISRSEGSGSFRDWFTPSDLRFFNKQWGPVLDKLGYPRRVQLNPDARIDPKVSSEYVKRNFHQRREMLTSRRDNIRRASAGSGDAASVYAELTERSDNGEVRASVDAARLALSGALGSRRAEEALAFARLAAQAGSEAGMEILVDLLSDATEPDQVREFLGWRRELDARRSEVDKRLAAELEDVRESTSYRLGNAFVRAAKSPRQEAPASAREVVELWRSRRR